MSMILQQCFHAHIGGKKSCYRTLLNGVTPGSIISPLLLNLHTCDIPTTTSKKYIFDDDIALKTCHKDFLEIERVLSQDMDILSTYFTDQRLKLNTTKTISSVFHFANCRAEYKLSIQISSEKLPFERTPKYFGITLDYTLSYKQHLTDISSKVTKQCNLLKRLTSNHWGADFSTLRSSALALCYSAAEYCSPVWSQSHHSHKVNVALNECLRLVSGCIKSTPTDILPVLCGNEPADIRRDKNISEFCNHVFSEEDHILNNLITHPLTTD